MLSDDELAAIAEIPLHGDVPRLVAEIRALRAENERLRAALQLHAGKIGGHEAGCGYWSVLSTDESLCSGRCRITRAALDDRAPRETSD